MVQSNCGGTTQMLKTNLVLAVEVVIVVIPVAFCFAD